MKAGYTGKVYIVIDDEDKTEAGYRERFGDKVLQFCKAEWAAKTDEGDNFQHRKAIVYARNACWDLAKQVGCRWFCQMDDDYKMYHLRVGQNGNEITNGRVKKTMDEVVKEVLKFYQRSKATACAIAQGGDYIGGNGGDKRKLTRKCMNSWFCDVEKQIAFFGHMNEDVSAYVTYGHRGQLFFTVMQAMLNQLPTQVTPGGMSDAYLESGTYVKSFYTVMAAPSCVKIGLMGDPRGGRTRIHHKINWNNTVPKILREQYRKVSK